MWTEERACKCNCPPYISELSLEDCSAFIGVWKKQAGLPSPSAHDYPRQALCACPFSTSQHRQQAGGGCFMQHRGVEWLFTLLAHFLFSSSRYLPEHLTLDLLSSVLPEKHFSSSSSSSFPLPSSPPSLSLFCLFPAALSSRFESLNEACF